MLYVWFGFSWHTAIDTNFNFCALRSSAQFYVSVVLMKIVFNNGIFNGEHDVAFMPWVLVENKWILSGTKRPQKGNIAICNR